MIATSRIELVPATEAHLRAALAGRPALAQSLAAVVPESWPPEFLDDAALEFTIARLVEHPEQGEWWMYFALRPSPDGRRTLVGSAGYKGPPSEDGTVEIGYGIVADQRLQGLASEAAQAMVSHAFADGRVRRVIAETLPELTGSIGVLKRCGFRFLGEGSEAGVIRFEKLRV